MSWSRAARVLAGCLWLIATGAGAETYRILSGTLTDAATGRSQELVGAFEAAIPEFPQSSSAPTSFLVPDFELEAGGRSFTPRQPIEYQGMTPTPFLEIANHLQIDGDRVGLVYLRSGGEQIADDGQEVTFRFLDFRARGSYPGGAVGRLGDGPLPRRLHIEGTLREVEQSFRLFSEECGRPSLPPVLPAPTPPPPPDGGGIIVIGGGGAIEVGGNDGSGGTIQIGGSDGAIVTWDEFDISGDETVTFVPPDGATQPLARVIGGEPVGIEGQLLVDGSVFILAPSPLSLGPTSALLAPTLEALGISAPDGADVTFDEAGVLTVTTEGDLLVEGRSIDVAGLTSLVLVAAGSIVVRGTLVLAPGSTLRIEAGVSVEIEDGTVIDILDGIVIIETDPPTIPDPPIAVICHGLRTVFPSVERVVGRFSLVATAAQPVEIDVDPWSRHDRVHPGRRQLLPVALLGSEDLDVRDVDVRSLRLGPGEAAPWAHFGRRRGIDVNRDRRADLVALFSVREAEIAFGDRVVCLVGETRDGDMIEGCDEIDSIPRWGRAQGRQTSGSGWR
jgi:filamentous hemagglutinin family protein